jgi:hypothetical protein
MLRKFNWLILVILAGLSACKDSGPVLPSATGTRYEILVVVDDSLWKAPSGRALVQLLDQNMASMPQAEPIMSITRCTRSQFGDIFKPSRNILLTEVGSRFEIADVKYMRNRWAQPQSVVKIVAKNDSLLADIIKKEGAKILDYYLSTERNRWIKFAAENVNHKAINQLDSMFGITLDIPEDLRKVHKGKDFFWVTNDHPGIRKDIVVYTVPYNSVEIFKLENLIKVRDSVMKVNIPGEFEGSYMGTELKYDQPIKKEISLNKNYCVEFTGLWRIYKGGSMGGPFYSHVRIDEVNQKVIFAEGFIFAPGTKKRNHIRQMEAAIYTMKLPQERNEIKEVEVVAEKKK